MSDKKIDRRVRYTKKAIRESFLDLLEEKPIEKISVTEICKNADINRGTFYSHYADPFELKRSLEQELVDIFAARAAEEGSLDATAALTILKENKDHCRLFCGPNGDMEAFVDIIMKHSVSYFDDVLKEGEEIPETHEKCLRAMLVSALSALIKFWYQNGMQEDPALIADCLDTFCIGGTERFCESIAKKSRSNN